MPNNLNNKLDGFQVLKSVFDPATNCLRVCVVEGSTGGGSGFEVIITHTDDSIRLGDGTNFFTSTVVGPKTGLDVSVINELDIENLDASKDNIAIQDDDGHRLNINADGSLPVTISGSANVTEINNFNEVSSVAQSTETTLLTFTALAGRETYIQKIDVSGENIAEYRIKVQGSVVDKKRTYFGAGLDAKFRYDGQLNNGYRLSPGQTLTVTVIHERPMPGDFNARATLVEVL